MDDRVLQRITYQAQHAPLAPVPSGLVPSGTPYTGAADDPLPTADVIVASALA